MEAFLHDIIVGQIFAFLLIFMRLGMALTRSMTPPRAVRTPSRMRPKSPVNKPTTTSTAPRMMRTNAPNCVETRSTMPRMNGASPTAAAVKANPRTLAGAVAAAVLGQTELGSALGGAAAGSIVPAKPKVK